MMIDWVSAKIPLSHFEPIEGGRFVSINKDDSIEYEVRKFLTVSGSHDSKISIKTLHHGPDGEIYFSGNPIKFLQGHNLFGSTDLIGMMAATLEKVFAILNITPSPENLEAINTGNYGLTRLDTTEMYDLPTEADVHAWIRAAYQHSHSRHKSQSVLKGSTLYWGKHSRGWTYKAYAKGQELAAKGHELPHELPFREELIAWAANKLRLELTLRRKELEKSGMRTAAAFCNSDVRKVFHSYRERISLPDNFSLAPEILVQLPQYLRSTYVLWRNGEDLRSTLSKNTFYRHRRELLEHGIDIIIKQTHDTSNAIPLLRILNAKPTVLPAFAIGTALCWSEAGNPPQESPQWVQGYPRDDKIAPHLRHFIERVEREYDTLAILEGRRE